MKRRQILAAVAASLFGVFAVRTQASAQNDERASAHAKHPIGAVFTVSNEAHGNRVLSFVRHRDGSLTEGGAYATGGTGLDASLSSQNALVLSDDHRFLLVVNAGSNEVSSFAVHGATLSLRARVGSQGVRPVSITTAGDLVFVANAGAPSNVAGFWLDPQGGLHPLPGSIQTLSVNDAGPGQVEVTPDGRELVVTERLSDHISSFPIAPSGRLGNPRVTASAGKVPFGFDFTRRGVLLVSEAATKSLSSYALTRGGELDPISAAIPDQGQAPCWVLTSGDQRHVFVANAGSQSISSYTIDRHGALTLAAAVAGDAGAGSAPQDLALEPHGSSLYLLDRGNAGIARFDASDATKMTYLDLTGELPPFASGLAVH